MSKVMDYFFVSSATPAGCMSCGASRMVAQLETGHPGCYIQQLQDEKAIRLRIAELLVEKVLCEQFFRCKDTKLRWAPIWRGTTTYASCQPTATGQADWRRLRLLHFIKIWKRFKVF